MAAPERPGNPRERGVTLLEMTLALSVLVVGLVPMAQVLVTTDRYRLDAEVSYRMHLLAANQLEGTLQRSGSVQGLLRDLGDGPRAVLVAPGELRGLPVSDPTGSVAVEELVPGTSVRVRVQLDFLDGAGVARTVHAETIVTESES